IPMAFYFGGKFGFVSIAVFPVVTVPIIILGKRLRKVTRQMQEKFADITSIMEESFTGARIVKAFNMENHEISKFEAVNMRVFNYFKKMLKVTIVQKPLIEILGAFGAAFAIWFGMRTLPADRFVAFIGSMFMFYEPIKKLSKVNSSIQQSIGAGSRIFEIIDQIPAIQERRDAVHFQGAVHSVAFHHVGFWYSEGKEILKGIDFTVRSGEVVAIVGPSGAGKTTLVNLIPRFYDPQKGFVAVNGRDIREFSVKSLRDQIGLVTQETILFNDSIRGNISYGKPEASEEDIRRAAEMAHADEFIRELPEQYGTNIGEKGNLLSGGQKQRISIARAILKNPPILILDEATSQLDTESEREVQKALENLMQGKTVFVIAHRLSTVQKADRILVLEEGGIVQEGTHDFLRGKEGVYKRLYELQ
ncbi:MAG TPA: ABC transporter ATP-binding protein, partial [Candidatus Omnitrophota bacterium]|nr:ABC transporter ATP-binding protein [Candidatus Omnitrophota bacterium]